MFSLFEFQAQSSLLHKSGTVEINTKYHTKKKPAWLIALKLFCVLGMVAVGAAIAVPTLLEFEYPLWQAVAITAGTMLVYTVVSFYLRPEPNTDNLGWGGGLMNDPFQASDNVNRFLWRLHCCLGPGRFTAEALLDTCAFFGAAKSEEVGSETAANHDFSRVASVGLGSFDATRPIAPLDPNRFAQSSANFVAGQIQLDTQRFLKPSAAEGQPAKV